MKSTPTDLPRQNAELHAVPPWSLLESRVRELERANTELVEVAHLTAHDLKEPLCAIVLLAEMLAAESQDLDGDRRQLIESLRASALRMQTTVDETLAAARGDRAELALVDMDDVVAEALRQIAARPERHAVKVRVDRLPSIVGDRTQLIRLMQNLLCNAVKFAADSRHPRVSVSAFETPTGWTFEVRDNGIGMAPTDAERLFQPFERDVSDPRSGDGLGLTIARQVVERHGGTIAIQSAHGCGAVVRFSLPHAQPVERVARVDEPALEPVSGGRAS
jgi:signal transduction histidine kinase